MVDIFDDHGKGVVKILNDEGDRKVEEILIKINLKIYGI